MHVVGMYACMYACLYLCKSVCKYLYYVFRGFLSAENTHRSESGTIYGRVVDNILLGHVFSEVGFPARTWRVSLVPICNIWPGQLPASCTWAWLRFFAVRTEREFRKIRGATSVDRQFGEIDTTFISDEKSAEDVRQWAEVRSDIQVTMCERMGQA